MYSKRNYTRLQWDLKTSKRRALDRLVEKLITKDSSSDTRKTAVLIGDGSVSSTSYTGRNKRPASCALLNAFKRNRRCRLFMVDEYNTTQTCSGCLRPLALPPKHKSPNTSTSGKRRHEHRFQVCPNCNVVWNRDVNAARNIIVAGLGLVNFHERKLSENTTRQSPDESVCPVRLRSLRTIIVTLNVRL